MANELHTTIIDPPITKQNLIDQGFKIDKHRVMVDSRAYEEEAFEYILKLADIAGAIVFVYDTKKIWANGRYFGGDIFEEDLKYFTTIWSLNDIGDATGNTAANAPLSNLFIQGKSHLEVTAKQNNDDPFYKNVLEFDYNLDEAVNKDFITIGDSRYNLIVEDGQIKLNKYTPISIYCTGLEVREYDHYDYMDEVTYEKMVNASFSLHVSGSLPPTEVGITSDIDGIEISQNANLISAKIPMNTTVKFTIKYTDGVTSGEATITQKWGYGVWAGTFNGNGYTSPDAQTLEYLANVNGEGLSTTTKYLWVPSSKISVKQQIDQNDTSWGIFVAPVEYNGESFDYEFVDMSTNLTGGWTPMFANVGDLYESKVKYMLWQTDHTGIGKVVWEIKGTSK